ncbi:MAG: transglutaminase-like domain-containing protein [Clostridiales Family XIII bacterium]|nr:transglutaminase-like domain-containing protein [Clostridiales Family XIII bacterium]
MYFLTGTSYCYIPQSIYRISHHTRNVAGLVVRDKTDEYYEYEAKFLFNNRSGQHGKMNFTFLMDAVEGFDEDAVTFSEPNVTYDVAAAEDGWRRLTINCKGLNADGALIAKLRYPADVLAVRDTAPGYYKWDIETYTEEDIPELDSAITSFKNPYACANWIRQNIDYENIAKGPQTAAETFRIKKGDCDDIAILFCYMTKRLFPEMEPRVVEGWIAGGGYHANVAVHTDAGWLMLDPSLSSARFGVFDFGPFVPSGTISTPFRITNASGCKIDEGGIDISFGDSTVRNV